MPWTIDNPPSAIKNRKEGAIAAGVKAANSCFERGQDEESCIFAAIAAANAWDKKNQPLKKSLKPDVPIHVKAILEAKKIKEQEELANLQKAAEEVKLRQVTAEKVKVAKAYLPKNAIESDEDRSLVAAEWDKQGRLTLSFDDGEKIITSPVPVQERIEQYIGVNNGGLPDQFDHIQFNTESLSEVLPGRLVWNADEGTLDLGMNHGGVTQQIGLETLYRVKNQTGTLLADGTVVMAVGAVGNSGHILVAPANNNLPPQVTMGVVTHDIPNGENGFVTHFGIVRGINTTGASIGETWNDGDILYLHPTQLGKLTKVKPAAPKYHVMVALVVHAHPNGQLFVRPTYGQKLDEIDDVDVVNPQNGQILKYDSATGVWKNVNPAAASGVTTSSFFVKVNTTADTPTVINHGMVLIDQDAFTINAMLGGEMVEIGAASIDVNSLAVVTSVSTTNLCITIIGVIA